MQGNHVSVLINWAEARASLCSVPHFDHRRQVGCYGRGEHRLRASPTRVHAPAPSTNTSVILGETPRAWLVSSQSLPHEVAVKIQWGSSITCLERPWDIANLGKSELLVFYFPKLSPSMFLYLLLLFGCARSSLLPGRSLVAASEEYFLAVVAYHVTEHGL